MFGYVTQSRPIPNIEVCIMDILKWYGKQVTSCHVGKISVSQIIMDNTKKGLNSASAVKK